MSSEAPETIVFRIPPNGTLVGLHDDRWDFHVVGTLEVRRASHVEFEEDRQEWVAREAGTGELIAASPSRAACLRAEHRHFTCKLKEGYSPFRSS